MVKLYQKHGALATDNLTVHIDLGVDSFVRLTYEWQYLLIKSGGGKRPCETTATGPRGRQVLNPA